MSEAERYPRAGRGHRNLLLQGDRAQLLPALARDLAGQVNVIYVDPPFDTGATFESKATVRDADGPRRARQVAYGDRWGQGAYLAWLRQTLALLVPLLHPRGSLFVHLDWRASHHARLLLDELLSPDAFRAEIVWRYRRWPARTQNLQRMHDTLLYYGSGPGADTVFHTLYEPLAPSTLRTFGERKQRADFSSGHRRPGLDEGDSPGAPLSDVWDLPIVAPSSNERVGYPTQKPEALLERVLRISSNEGDLVLDCCCGSGTTAVAAERLGRRWIACDIGPAAVNTALRRLLALPSVRPFEVRRPAPGNPGKLRVSRRPGPGLSAELALLDYKTHGGEGDLSWVVAWTIDGLHERTFEADGWFTRPGRSAPLVTRARLTYRRPGRYPVAVRAIDVLGNEARWQGEIAV